MSTVVTENLKRASETASRSLRGVAASWVNFNGTGTVAIRDSENVASITDNGTGDYTENFTTAMSDANYAVVGQCSNDNNNAATYTETVQIYQNTPPIAGSVRMRAATVTASSSGIGDKTFIYLTTHGDLA